MFRGKWPGLASRFVATALVMTAAVAPAPTAAMSLLDQPKYAAILVDAKTGEVLYARRPDALRSPASITKVMTLYMAFEAIDRGELALTDRVTMTTRAVGMAPSRLGLRRGTSLSVDDAFRVMATKSANDVTVALAEKLGKTEIGFARMMTKRAHELGMTQTTFINSTGLPDTGHLTTARDLAILSLAMVKHFPNFYSYFGQSHFEYAGLKIQNHNHLLRTMPGVDGIKTGYTAQAGFTLAASAVRDGRRLIAVVLGGPSTMTRDANVRALLESGFDVMKSRAMGLKTTVSASLNEPNDFASLETATSVEQGSGDDGPSADSPPKRR